MTVLDWRNSRHWSGRPEPCVHCGRPTALRDAGGDPSHKVCAEAALDAAAARRKSQTSPEAPDANRRT